MRTAAFWALVFGALVTSKAVGYAVAAPSLADKAKLASSFSSNIGLDALLGTPVRIDTVAGYTAWNTLSSMIIIGAIWALMTATKSLRGEEDAGRWELLLSGQTTARRAALSTLAGLGAALATLYVVTATAFVLVGRVQTVGFTASSSLFFALAAVAAAAEFMAIGTLASQVMPTRAKAASVAGVVFGASFLVRATADISSAHWLLDVTPLGWIEKLQPLSISQPQWLVPIALFIVVCGGLTVWLAGRRDLGTSILPDRTIVKPHYRSLRSPLTAGLRLTRGASISWLVATFTVAAFFGMLTKAAAQAFTSSPQIERALSHFALTARENITLAASKSYLGIVFFFVSLIVMIYVANALAAARDEEAQGYLDNLLVRSVGRLEWLYGRLVVIVGVLLAAGLLGGVGAWVGEASQHNGVAFSSLIAAGFNTLGPACFVLGAGVLAFGFAPRVTSITAYAILAWSFLVQIVASGLKLNHWFLDTSLLYHMTPAPASDPDWRAVGVMVATGVLLCVVGGWRFAHRDLASE